MNMKKMHSHLLIVEDQAELFETIKGILESYFDEIQWASNGDQALTMIQAKEPSLILTDINMPGMGGIELVRRARAMGFQTPTIFLTAYGSKEYAMDALKLGVIDFIEKPFQGEELIQNVERVIDVEKRRRALYAQENQAESPEVNRQKKMLGLLQATGSPKRK